MTITINALADLVYSYLQCSFTYTSTQPDPVLGTR